MGSCSGSGERLRHTYSPHHAGAEDTYLSIPFRIIALPCFWCLSHCFTAIHHFSYLIFPSASNFANIASISGSENPVSSATYRIHIWYTHAMFVWGLVRT